MKIKKKYDIYFMLLRERVRNFLFKQLHDPLMVLGAAETFPDGQDMDFISTFITMYLLHLHKVEMDSDLLDLRVYKEDLFLTFSRLEELQEELKSYNMQMSSFVDKEEDTPYQA